MLFDPFLTSEPRRFLRDWVKNGDFYKNKKKFYEFSRFSKRSPRFRGRKKVKKGLKNVKNHVFFSCFSPNSRQESSRNRVFYNKTLLHRFQTVFNGKMMVFLSKKCEEFHASIWSKIVKKSKNC